MTLGLREKITIGSAIVMAMIIAVFYLVQINGYRASLISIFDEQLRRHAKIVKRQMVFDKSGRIKSFQEIAFGDNQFHYVVRDSNNNIIWRSRDMIFLEPPGYHFSSQQTSSMGEFRFNDGEYRIFSIAFPKSEHRGADDYVIQIIRPLKSIDQYVSRLAGNLLMLVPLPMLLVVAGSWIMASRVLRSMYQLVNSIGEIGADDLSSRLDSTGGGEVESLSLAFNNLLQRLDESFNALKRFTADASHELRTPLTVMRSKAEVALTKQRTNEQYREVLGEILEEVNRLEQLITSLLQLARGDAGIDNARITTENVSILVRRWVDLILPLAEEKNTEIVLQQDTDVYCRVDQSLFQLVVSNLFQNAIQYSPAANRIVVSLADNGATVQFNVCDNGPGISPEDKSRVFERFSRLKQSRQEATGAGLGLAIVKWAVDAHRGRITITDNAPCGCCFNVELPK